MIYIAIALGLFGSIMGVINYLNGKKYASIEGKKIINNKGEKYYEKL